MEARLLCYSDTSVKDDGMEIINVSMANQGIQMKVRASVQSLAHSVIPRSSQYITVMYTDLGIIN